MLPETEAGDFMEIIILYTHLVPGFNKTNEVFPDT
jgi:hypothetical protein